MKCMGLGFIWAFIPISYAAFIGDIFVNDDSTVASNPGDDGVGLLWPGGTVYYK